MLLQVNFFAVLASNYITISYDLTTIKVQQVCAITMMAVDKPHEYYRVDEQQ